MSPVPTTESMAATEPEEPEEHDSTGPPSPLTELRGTTLGERYLLGDVLGAGGMGAVFKAHDSVLDRPVAIKVIRPALAESGEYIKRFLREAQTASKIRHRNVVMSLDYGEVDGLVYSVMELLEGKDIKQLLKDSPDRRLPWAQACELLAQVASGLRAAHDKGVIHRDIKPANCFVIEEDGQSVVKLVDFGIAKVDDANDAEQITHTSQVLGTPSYIAPELVRTKGAASPRADVYSMGVMAYRLLTGNLPFSGETSFEVMYRACTEPVPKLRKQVPDIPVAVEELVLDMLAKDPEQRPADTGQVRDRLRQALQRGSTGARGGTRWPLLLGAAALVAALGGVAWSMVGGDPPSAAATVASVAGPSGEAAEPAVVAPADAEVGEAVVPPPADGAGEAVAPPPTEGAGAEDPQPSESDTSPKRSRREGTKKLASKKPSTEDAPKAGAIPVELSDADLQPTRAKASKVSKACGRKHMSITSKLQVKLQVKPSGAVSSASVLAPMDVQPVGRCVAEEVETLSFPQSQQGLSTTWTLPLR